VPILVPETGLAIVAIYIVTEEVSGSHDVSAPPATLLARVGSLRTRRVRKSGHQQRATGFRLPHPANPTRASFSTFMAPPKHLELEDLGEGVKKVLIDCGEQLRSAPFKDNGNFDFIDDRKTLEEASRDFVKMQSSKVSA